MSFFLEKEKDVEYEIHRDRTFITVLQQSAGFQAVKRTSGNLKSLKIYTFVLYNFY